jgi:hypothetical protein
MISADYIYIPFRRSPGVETAPMLKSVVGVFFTCMVCGTVEEIHVPREEGLPPKVYWECLTCQLQNDGATEERGLREGVIAISS